MNSTQLEQALNVPPKIDVRGYTSHNTLARPPLRVLSNVIDLCIVLGVVLLIADSFKITPTPRWSLLFIFLSVTTLYWVPQKKLLGVTLGERAWLLTPKNKEFFRFFKLKEILYRRDFLAPLAIISATLATALSVVTVSALFQRVVLTHPNWLQTDEWRLEPFVPDPKNWTVNPFFYLLGGWPKSFKGKTIFYSLPYEGGPPTRFVGHVQAYWEYPNISVTYEGPKTPDLTVKTYEVKKCFTGLVVSLHCLSLREKVLNRPISEIQKSKDLLSWKIKWFKVVNPLLTPEEVPQGVYLSAIGKTWTQDRFILINANGTHQAIILRRPNNQVGQEAFELLKNSLGSLTFNELSSGRAWIDQELAGINLKELEVSSTLPLLSTRLSGIQQLLISKITVDPADFNSYFHLAGTSVMLAKSNLAQRLQIKIALNNLESALLFATDISPLEPRLRILHRMESDLRKLLTP